MSTKIGANNVMALESISKMRGLEFRTHVRARLRDDKPADKTLVEGDHVLNPGFHAKVVEVAVKPAAVLIPVIERESGLNLIFTKRTEKLRSHSGQISFPGGKIDTGDESAKYAALRETDEEIGIGRTNIEVLGQMPDYFTGSGYKISSIVGLIDADVQFNPSPDEVEYIFEVPLAFLMNSENHKIGSRVFENTERYFYEMPWNDHYIWGVTAGIVRLFFNKVFK